MTTSTTTNTTQTIKLLTLLKQYEALHTTANDNLKSSIFNITKARKFSSSSSGVHQQYSPDDVREELRASALLELQDDIDDGNVDDIEPNLVKEDDVPSGDDDGGAKISGEVSKGSKKFVLHLDGMREVAKQQTAPTGCQQLGNNITGVDNIESEGLRRRRKGKTEDTKSSSEDRSNKATSDVNKWTIEDETPNNTSNNDEEQSLQSVDPINLFGVPPPALKVAQTKSRYAIAYYVEVANLAREIMNITNQD
jgi:hypothetical protein